MKTMKNIGAIIVVVAGIYGSLRFIDGRIEHAVNDEQFIKKVSSHVRPYIIFDLNGSILVDGGASQYLEKLEVEEADSKFNDNYDHTIKIVVTPTDHLAYPPLLEKLGAGRIMLTPNPKRGNEHQWVYDNLDILHYDEDEIPVRFRLEILK